MALSTLRVALRPSLLAGSKHVPFLRFSAPVVNDAQDQMKAYWEKNIRLKRPNSPWIIYWPHVPMMSSLTHRTTGICMGVALYAISFGLLAKSGDFNSLMATMKGWELSPIVMGTAKTICAFPLIYHFCSGTRHLVWDAGYAYELATQYKTGYTVFTLGIVGALIAGTFAYW